jgi:hypothetical protein
MRYAVLQTSLDTPSIEQMARAIPTVPGLTAADAHILGNDAFGILVKDFSTEQARALQGALRAEGVETEIVEQSLLPVLPQAHLAQRLDGTPEHLLIHDPLGRTFRLEWAQITFIAAGAVRLTDFVRREQKRTMTRYTAGGMAYHDTEYETVSREERNEHLMAEIFASGPTPRYSFTADKFNFAGLGERNLHNTVANFSLTIRDLAQFGAGAALNQGAGALSQDATKIFSYPSKNAFYEEIVWTHWQMKKGA